MIKLCPIIPLLFALVTPSVASATDYCNGITVTHSPPADWTTLLTTISQKYPPDGKYAFRNAIQLGEWRIVHVDDLYQPALTMTRSKQAVLFREKGPKSFCAC
jgi:hypothetical protein